MKKEFAVFIEYWIETTTWWSYVAIGCALVIIVVYLLLLLAKGLRITRGTLVKKHQFISSQEINYLWYTGLSLTVAFTLFLNTLLVGFSTGSEFVLAIKTVVSVAGGFIIGFIINSYLKVLYPSRLEKRLNKLRFKPRYNPTTGHKLRLLTEDEEDVHLTADMIEHEISSEYEYDVWLDEESGFKIIETYSGKLHVLICDNCNYRTAKEYKQGVAKEPTGTEPGILIKYYKCSNCDHLQREESTIPALANLTA